MHIVDMVNYWARATPLRAAAIEPQGVITYAAMGRAMELAAEHFARNIVDRSKPVALSLSTGSKMLVALLGLLRAEFNVILATKSDFKYIPSTGAHTLVCEHGGPALDKGTNIHFDDGWLTFGTKAEIPSTPIFRTTP